MDGARRAARLFGAAAVLDEQNGAPEYAVQEADYASHHAAARSKLGEKGWITAWTEGRAMTLDQAIAYALEDTGKAAAGP
jgi:hypothetical protein